MLGSSGIVIKTMQYLIYLFKERSPTAEIPNRDTCIPGATVEYLN